MWLALAYKRKNLSNKVFIINSDGEMEEGSNWEFILFASHHKLDNLTLIIDYNNYKALTVLKYTQKLEPLR